MRYESHEIFIEIFFNHFCINPFSLLEFNGWAELKHSAFAHNNDFVWSFESGESMCDGDDCAVFKLFLDNFLNDLIVFHIDVGSGFVNDNDFTLFEEGATNAQQLFFASWKTVIVDHLVQSIFLHHDIVQIAFL